MSAPNRESSWEQAQNTMGGRKMSSQEYEQDTMVNKIVYDSSNNWQVFFQMHGSVWPKVFKFCVLNVLNTIIVIELNKRYDIDLSFSDRGHTFMSMMVSFLMVTRSNIAYSRYMEARKELAEATSACRELVSHAVTFTRYETLEEADDWRLSMAKNTIKLLRTMVAVLEYQSTGIHAWKVDILSKDEKKAIHEAVGKSNERIPIMLTMFVKTTIASNRKYLKEPLHVNKELKLYSILSDFVHSYHGLMKLVTTPFPFPLVQMTRTFLFIWIFTLPWVLEGDVQRIPALLFTVFFITYAFIGLEYVSIELDDPYGDDPNDFNLMGLASVTFKDIYLYIYDVQHDKHDPNRRAKSQELFRFIQTAEMSKKDEEETVPITRGKKGHGRYPSQIAWANSIAVDKKIEAGLETSQLLEDQRRSRTIDLELMLGRGPAEEEIYQSTRSEIRSANERTPLVFT